MTVNEKLEAISLEEACEELYANPGPEHPLLRSKPEESRSIVDLIDQYDPAPGEDDAVLELLEYSDTFLKIVEEFESVSFVRKTLTDRKLKGKSVPRNNAGFPVVFWPEAEEEDVWRLAVRVLCRAEEDCDHVFPPSDSNGPAGVLFLWVSHWISHGTRSILSGIEIDFIPPRHGLRRPTLLAHKAHHAPFNLGFACAMPTSLDDYDESKVNARVELWLENRLVCSWRLPVLVSMLRSAGE